jgi:hypothetical protein
MQGQLSIGDREGQLLEFRSAAAIRHPEMIAREGVSMLNAARGTGDACIGIAERDGIARRCSSPTEYRRRPCRSANTG